MSITADKFLHTCNEYVGTMEGTERHKEIVDIYNSINPLPRGYMLKYSDSWCAAFLSSMAVLNNALDVFPAECSVYYMVKQCEAKEAPERGDLIVYDFDGEGFSHIGVIEFVENGEIQTIEGNYSDMVKKRVLWEYDSNIQGFYGVTWDKPTNNSLDDVVNACIRGEYGNGEQRKILLSLAGYSYEEVQQAINKKLSS